MFRQVRTKILLHKIGDKKFFDDIFITLKTDLVQAEHDILQLDLRARLELQT